MNPLDERFALNSITDLAYTDPIYSDGSSSHYLNPRDAIILRPSTFPISEFNLNIDVDEGVYRMIVSFSQVDPNLALFLYPNGLSYGNIFTLTYIVIKYDDTTSSYSKFGLTLSDRSAFEFDSQSGYYDTNPGLVEWLISTYTVNKQCTILGGSNNGISYASTTWPDTTTKWFTLGKLTPVVPTSFSDLTVFVERLR